MDTAPLDNDFIIGGTTEPAPPGTGDAGVVEPAGASQPPPPSPPSIRSRIAAIVGAVVIGVGAIVGIRMATSHQPATTAAANSAAPRNGAGAGFGGPGGPGGPRGGTAGSIASISGTTLTIAT